MIHETGVGKFSNGLDVNVVSKSVKNRATNQKNYHSANFEIVVVARLVNKDFASVWHVS